MKNNEDIRKIILEIVHDYPITRVDLFGSRAQGTHRDDSDVDLFVEFSKPVSLITICTIKDVLEGKLGLKVDLLHGSLEDDAMIEIKEVIELYAA